VTEEPVKRGAVKSPKLRLWHYGLLAASLLALWGTGLAWVWLHYFGEIEGEFGPEPNPLNPFLLSLHGFFLLPALLAMGGLMAVHIGMGWRYRHKRNSGIAQTALYLTLILTGYGLYYAGDDLLRENLSLAHWTIGAAAPVIFIWHLIVRLNRP
jgi:hypothetical protein